MYWRRFVPCIPHDWESYKVHYRYKNTLYHITLTQNSNASKMKITMDGIEQEDSWIVLQDDVVEHHVEVLLCSDISM